MEKMSIEKLMELYVDTIDKCGTYLLSEDDMVIGYNIFEEFDTGVTSFLYADILQRLNDAGLISDEMMNKSSILRNLFLELQQGDEWNIDAVRSSSKWRKVLELADEIKGCLAAE
ncbi:hypothetical protein [Paenibacillus kribbensis]|uniref:hypothetical protein n=1 Tax=Paenibacillus kribbensis TaxID=172713 RepID=UPI000838D561|nr:hypothetical protein [Paenibacillus kribbensis]